MYGKIFWVVKSCSLIIHTVLYHLLKYSKLLQVEFVSNKTVCIISLTLLPPSFFFSPSKKKGIEQKRKDRNVEIMIYTVLYHLLKYDKVLQVEFILNRTVCIISLTILPLSLFSLPPRKNE